MYLLHVLNRKDLACLPESYEVFFHLIQVQISREITKEIQHSQTGESEKINIITAIKSRVFNVL